MEDGKFWGFVCWGCEGGVGKAAMICRCVVVQAKVGGGLSE